ERELNELKALKEVHEELSGRLVTSPRWSVARRRVQASATPPGSPPRTEQRHRRSMKDGRVRDAGAAVVED
ncbi:hypothetical protein ACLESO_60145, partial [Pyxidicoccus sp. 3LG]